MVDVVLKEPAHPFIVASEMRDLSAVNTIIKDKDS